MNLPRPIQQYIAPRQGLFATTLRTTLLVAAGVAVVFILVTLLITQQRSSKQAVARLQEVINASTTMSGVACFANDATLAQETAAGLLKHRDVKSVSILTLQGELANARQAEGSGVLFFHYPTEPISQPVFSPFDPNERIGKILVTPNWHNIEEHILQDMAYSATILLSVAFGLALMVGLVIAFRIIRPVKQLSDSMHALDASTGASLSVPPAHRHNELGRLAEDVNDLLERFRLSLEREHEINLQRVMDEKLRLQSEVFEHSQEGIMVTDADNCIIAVNAAFTRITGYTELDVIGRNPRLLASGVHDVYFYNALWQTLLADGMWKGELWNRRKDGEVIPNWFSINTIHDESGNVLNYVGIFSDISERKEAEQRIHFLAHHDALTRLPNRTLLRDRFSQACTVAQRSQTKIAILFIDLDNFKHVNDSFGHYVGDQLLLEVVNRLKESVRDSDTICRQGGDEFIVMLSEVPDMEVVTRVAQNILTNLATPFDLNGNPAAITASVGISLFPDDSADLDVLLGNADAAMYASKASGKNNFRYFTESMNRDAQEKLRLQAELRQAIINQEFVLHYQPQVNLSTGKINGVEALIRWNHPIQGMVYPEHFIPIAEESGLITEIGDWVIETALKQGKSWVDQGMPDLVVAINISALQFNRSTFIASVERHLASTGFPAANLEFELTESSLLHDSEAILGRIHTLKGLGLKLSIDDFGTGYSSLSYLKRMNVDKLKIDRSFVRDICTDADDLAIVRAIIQLSKTLKLTVIAEGAEEAEQVQILMDDGCDEVQGYYFGHPEPFETLTPRLTEHNLQSAWPTAQPSVWLS